MNVKLLLLTILLGSQGFLFGMGGPGATRENIAGATPVTQRRVPTLFELSLQALGKRLEKKIASDELDEFIQELDQLPIEVLLPLIFKVGLRSKNLNVETKVKFLRALDDSELISERLKKTFWRLRTLLRNVFPMDYKGDLTKEYFTEDVQVFSQIFPLRQTLLHNAIINKNPQFVRLLLDAGADIDAESGELDKPENTPLLWAIKLRHMPLIEFLLDRGADVNKKTGSGTPLEVAVDILNKELVELLIKAGGDVNKVPLLWRAHKPWLRSLGDSSDIDLFKLLISAGADVNQKVPPIKRFARFGSTKKYHNILNYVVSHNEIEKAKLLLEAKAKVNTSINNNGDTVLDTAIRSGDQEMIKLLKKYGAKRGSE